MFFKGAVTKSFQLFLVKVIHRVIIFDEMFLDSTIKFHSNVLSSPITIYAVIFWVIHFVRTDNSPKN